MAPVLLCLGAEDPACLCLSDQGHGRWLTLSCHLERYIIWWPPMLNDLAHGPVFSPGRKEGATPSEVPGSSASLHVPRRPGTALPWRICNSSPPACLRPEDFRYLPVLHVEDDDACHGHPLAGGHGAKPPACVRAFHTRAEMLTPYMAKKNRPPCFQGSLSLCSQVHGGTGGGACAISPRWSGPALLPGHERRLRDHAIQYHVHRHGMAARAMPCEIVTGTIPFACLV